MITRQELLAYARDTYGVEPDYPWQKYPQYAILRHLNTRKWFGAILEVSEDKLGLAGSEIVEILNVKCDPILMGSLREEPGIFPAYHMNKAHWITILLKGPLSAEMIFSLLDHSFDLTHS